MLCCQALLSRAILPTVYSVSCSPAIPAIWWAIQLGGIVENHPIPPPSLHGGEGSSFAGLVSPNDTIDYESVVSVFTNWAQLLGFAMPVNTAEQEVSFDEADAMPSSVSLGYLCLVSTCSDTFRLQLAPSFKCLTLWC